MKIPAFGISLAVCKDRRESIQNEAVKAGLDLELVDAIYANDFKSGGTVDFASLMEIQPCTTGEDGLPGYHSAEIAIYASHIKTYRRILELGLDYAFVLEDDAGWMPNRIGTLGLVASLLTVPDWFHCSIHNCIVPNGGCRVIDHVNPVLNQIRQAPLTTVAAVVTRKFCSVVVEEYSVMNLPIDQLVIHISNDPAYKFLQTTEYMFSSGGFESKNVA